MTKHIPIGPVPKLWKDEQSRRTYVDNIFDDTAHEYDFVERLLGLGRGPWYRRQALLRCGLEPGMRMLDVAIGTGLVSREAITILGGEGHIVGLDPSEGMLGQARTVGVPLVRGFGEKLPFPDASFDFVSMGFALRHVTDLDALFAEIRRVLRPGGIAAILELTKPEGRVASAAVEAFMTGVVPAFARLAGRRGAGDLMRFYWETTAACVRPAEVIAAMERAGLKTKRHVEIGLFSEYVGRP